MTLCSIGWCHQGVRVPDCHDTLSISSHSLFFFNLFQTPMLRNKKSIRATFDLDVLTHHLLFVLDPFNETWYCPTTYAFSIQYDRNSAEWKRKIATYNLHVLWIYQLETLAKFCFQCTWKKLTFAPFWRCKHCFPLILKTHFLPAESADFSPCLHLS